MNTATMTKGVYSGTSRLSRFLLLAASFLMAGHSAEAVNVTKLDTTSLVTNTSNWSAAPSSTDVGEFDATPSASTLTNLTTGGGTLNFGGFQFDNNLNGPVTILPTGTLNIGTSGIDMSQANQDVTVSCGLGVNGNFALNVGSGRTLTFATGISASSTARVVTKLGDGALALGGGINLQSTGGGEGFLVKGGTVIATSVLIGRNNYPASVSAIGVPATAGANNSGLYVSNSTSVVTFTSTNTTSYIGYQNSGATARIDDGTVSISGPLVLGRTSNTRCSLFHINGGSLTSTDTGTGIQIAPNYSSVANTAVLYMPGGITTFEKIQFGASGDTLGGNGYVTLAGGTLYVGSWGPKRIGAQVCLFRSTAR
jgi:hypothetical protein